MLIRAACLMMLTVLVACGEGSGGGGTGGVGGAAPYDPNGYLPLKVGNRWRYRVTEVVDGSPELSEKTTSIEAEGVVVGGSGPHKAATAFRVVTDKGLKGRTVSWQLPLTDRTIRFRELAFDAGQETPRTEDYWDPPRLVIDLTPAHMAAGATWTVAMTEYKLAAGQAVAPVSQSEQWSVLAENEMIAVPGRGSLPALKLRKTNLVGGSGLSKTYWYVKGVGKVREEGGQLEELLEFEIKP